MSEYFSQRQTRPSSGSMTSPTWRKPHLVRTRVEAFGLGSVWAQTVRTFWVKAKFVRALGRFGCIAVVLMFGIDTVGDLDEAIGWRTFEAALADGVARTLKDHRKSVSPGIDGGRRAKRGEPLLGYFGPILGTHRLDHGESFFAGERIEDQRFRWKLRGGHR